MNGMPLYRILGLPSSRIEQGILGSLEFEKCQDAFDSLAGKYLIACTARSGSTLLSAAMQRYGLEFGEYLLLGEFVANAKREQGIQTTKDLAMLLSTRMSPEARLAVKAAYPDIPLLFLFGEFPVNISKWKFVFLTRRNLVRQAISGRIAEITGSWTSAAKPTQEVAEEDYDFQTILNILEAYANENRLWERFFNIFSIEPLRIEFESLVAELDITAETVAVHFGLDISKFPQARHHMPWPKKQTTTINRIWEERFRSDALRLGLFDYHLLSTQKL